MTSATVPAINLSGFNLDSKGWKYGFHHCFINRRLVRRNTANEFQYLAHTVQNYISSEGLRTCKLGKITNKFTQNVRHTKDNTYHDLRHLRSNKDIVLLTGDKDSSVVEMNKLEYIKKVSDLINKGNVVGIVNFIVKEIYENKIIESVCKTKLYFVVFWRKKLSSV